MKPTVITIPYDMACDIKYLPSKRHRKPHTTRGSHRVCGEVQVVEEKDFPVAFKVNYSPPKGGELLVLPSTPSLA